MKSNVDGCQKFVPVHVDLSKLCNVVKNDVVKNDVNDVKSKIPSYYYCSYCC